MGGGISTNRHAKVGWIKRFAMSISPLSRINFIVKSMNQCASIAEVQEWGADTLTRIIKNPFDSEKFVERLASLGGITTLIQVIRIHGKDEIVTRSAIMTLYWMSTHPKTADEMRLKGVIEVFRDIMAENADDEFIVGDGENTLANIEKFSIEIANEKIKDAVVVEKVADIVAIMNEHRERDLVQIEGCHGLWTLCSKDEYNAEQLRTCDGDGIGLLARLLQDHDDKPVLLTKVCTTICKIADNTFNCLKLGKCGVCSGLVSVIRTYPEERNLAQMAVWSLEKMSHQEINVTRMEQMELRLVLHQLVTFKENEMKETGEGEAIIIPLRLAQLMNGERPTFQRGPQRNDENDDDDISSDTDSLADWDEL
eukprot:TRINITY_DN401_c0_g1_i6.p1 TRINITY_DN401_c0_g1~~TRINITY_DN401_c0_g1_i6.p1  ORF type:complete len:368 (-),score=92.32 TRINITY_DN401_c0_g1_i6:344-1447(-)